MLARLQQSAQTECKYKGVSVMTVKLVLIGGKLQNWSSPTLQHFEPREQCDDLMDALVRISEDA